jgi:hypothetical protein
MECEPAHNEGATQVAGKQSNYYSQFTKLNF